MSDEGDYRAAPATPGLLITPCDTFWFSSSSSLKKKKNLKRILFIIENNKSLKIL